MLQLGTRYLLLFALLQFSIFCAAQEWKGKWIGQHEESDTTSNIWLAYKKDFVVNSKPQTAIARIAVDSKYWLYVNDRLVVFEGGLKRGPNRNDTYFDQVELAPYLKKGVNRIAIKLWYFGKQGFSHHSSGKPGLVFDLQSHNVTLSSDSTWVVKRLTEYQTAEAPLPNFRLPESSLLYDARIADPDWYKVGANSAHFVPAQELGPVGVAPWNKLVRRPIPLWKDFGIRKIAKKDIERKGDTLICKLPYNMQFTPVIELEATGGERIVIATDNYFIYNGSAPLIRAEYLAKKGVQAYESIGWQNGHALYLVVPSTVQVLSVGYRETGYATEFAGSFSCADPFLNELWKKARRTLYITMRDTYMDCPDRERAQWTGDAVLEAEEAFYALDTNSHALAKKWLYELADWQREDGSLFAPVPAGNWDQELPDQVLASVGYFGVWTYYMHTGDRKLLQDLYPRIQRYIDLWEFDTDGLVRIRKGGWQWGDWGENKDMLLLYNLWYYLALKGSYLMAQELQYVPEALALEAKMHRMKRAFNKRFWSNGKYRDPAYTGRTDDRVHALAVLADIAGTEKYPAIEAVFDQEEHASPYMEKYVFEALYKMRLPDKANARQKKRFASMVDNNYFTTLFEGWEIGSATYGGGTVNHAWSGGGLTVLSAYLVGIRPLEPGYRSFIVDPQLGSLNHAEAKVSSIKGVITAKVTRANDDYFMEVDVPLGASGVIVLPHETFGKLRINNQDVYTVSSLKALNTVVYLPEQHAIRVAGGKWRLKITGSRDKGKSSVD